MNNMRNKILMTLALLLTAVTGAWAQTETLLTTITPTAKEQASYSTANVATVSFSYTANGSSSYLANWGWWGYGWSATVNASEGYTITKCIFYDDANRTATDSEAPFVVETTEEDKTPRINGTPIDGGKMSSKGINKIEVYGYKSEPAEPAEPALTVDWNPATKTGNFVMPAYDVELTPIYAPTAMFATEGNLVLTPTAIEGIYAESTDAIVKAGTVAKIGDTENPQGTVMYAVTSTNQATAPALDAFSADVPTAEKITVAGDVLVWYYIKGADTPTGEKATAENTFNDSEICTEPITVTVLSNKFDIQFNAANDNTIEAGKATVKVGDEAAEVDAKGKLTGVKMNSKVTITAKEGYKFRKVEVKKGIAPNTITVTWNKDDITGSGSSFTKDGVTVYANRPIDFYYKEFTRGGTFTTTLGNFTKIEVTAARCTAEGTNWTGDDTKKTWTGNAPSVRFNGNIIGRDNIKFVFTIEPTN